MVRQLWCRGMSTKIVAIWWPTTELQHGEISVEFELWTKIVSETDPKTTFAFITGVFKEAEYVNLYANGSGFRVILIISNSVLTEMIGVRLCTDIIQL